MSLFRLTDRLARQYDAAIARGDRAAAIILFGRHRAILSAHGLPVVLAYRWRPGR